MHVVTECLPEAGFVVVEQTQAANPLCAFPEIQVGHEKPSRPPMLDRKGLPSELPGDPSFSSGDVIELEVSGVSNWWGSGGPGRVQ